MTRHPGSGTEHNRWMLLIGGARQASRIHSSNVAESLETTSASSVSSDPPMEPPPSLYGALLTLFLTRAYALALCRTAMSQCDPALRLRVCRLFLWRLAQEEWARLPERFWKSNTAKLWRKQAHRRSFRAHRLSKGECSSSSRPSHLRHAFATRRWR